MGVFTWTGWDFAGLRMPSLSYQEKREQMQFYMNKPDPQIKGFNIHTMTAENTTCRTQARMFLGNSALRPWPHRFCWITLVLLFLVWFPTSKSSVPAAPSKLLHRQILSFLQTRPTNGPVFWRASSSRFCSPIIHHSHWKESLVRQTHHCPFRILVLRVTPIYWSK
jgi:hypothetical protein